ncbi:MAG: TolC family protein [Runella slithyformis]|nr:MAG: TolC family protein [Runella slithyformis]
MIPLFFGTRTTQMQATRIFADLHKNPCQSALASQRRTVLRYPRSVSCCLTWILALVCFTAQAQSDTAKVLSYRDFYDLVTRNHPVLKQANLISKDAQAELLMAKGNFDPKLEANFDQKYFDNKYYYNFWDTQLKVPVQWGGIDVKAGFERNVGLTLGTDIQTPPDGLSYVGVNVPILQRLMIDQRRATLQNVQIFQQIAETERIKMLNKLVLSAAKEYWNWYFTYRNYLLIKEFYELADARNELVRRRVAQGDLPAIDTADAQVTRYDRRVMLEQATLEFQNMRLILSNFLWDEQQNPRELPPFAVPQVVLSEQFNEADLARLLDLARQRHPETQKLEFKAQQLRVDERLSRNMLLPRFDVGVSSLNYAHRLITGVSSGSDAVIPNYYKLNFDFSMPLLFRKERGKLQQVQIKQLQNNFELKQLRREINNDVQASYNDVKNLERQIRDQQVAIERQQQVLRAEERRFSIGESQLFLVNQREAKLNELRVKLESMKSKYEKAKATLLFAAGTSE